MKTQESLHRLSSVFSGKAGDTKVKELAHKLGLDCDDQTAKTISSLGDNQAISEALVAAAVQAGKSEDQIAAAMG